MSRSLAVSPIRPQRVVLEIDPFTGEVRLAVFAEGARSLSRILVEHQLDVREDLRLEALHRIEAEPLVARVLHRAVSLRRTAGELARELVGALLELLLRHDLGDEPQALRFLHRYEASEQQQL